VTCGLMILTFHSSRFTTYYKDSLHGCLKSLHQFVHRVFSLSSGISCNWFVMQPFHSWYSRFAERIDASLNRGLEPGRELRLRIRWPLYLLPIMLFNQLVTPHRVWLVTSIMLLALYVLGYFWARSLTRSVGLSRNRLGTILVAGDSFTEEFVLTNGGYFPLVWTEFVDGSDLPGYNPSRVVGAGAGSTVRWKTSVECERRGLYRLGPHQLNFGDPFGLFAVTVDFSETDALLIYPRVVQLPRLALPRGNANGSDRRRRSMQGVQPAASVRDYQIGDSLRYVHWPTSAHRGDLTVKEMELEPSGDVWIVLDLNRAGHSGVGAEGTLEYSIVVAASLAAALLDSGEQRAVGLLAASGSAQTDGGSGDNDSADHVVLLSPQRGRAQLWQVLSTLAPVEPSDVSLAQLLRQSAPALGRRRSLVVITPQLDAGMPDEADGMLNDWTAELLHLQALGLHSSALLIVPHAERQADHVEARVGIDADVVGIGDVEDLHAVHTELHALLNRLDVPAEMLSVDVTLPPLLTYRRKRTVAVSTPTGGVVMREIEEEVG
jgi:uncharacterized protein (DUF58 family)